MRLRAKRLVAASGIRSLGPFPSNLFTVADSSHNTGLRVHLPKPECAVEELLAFIAQVLATIRAPPPRKSRSSK